MFPHFRNFRHSYFIIIFIISGIFRCFSIMYLPSLPAVSVILISSIFHHFRTMPSFSRLFYSIISENFRHSYFIISGFPSFMFRFIIISSFPSYSVVFRLSCSVISGNFCLSYFIISGLFRRRPVLAVRSQFDPGLFSLEIVHSSFIIHHYFIISRLFRWFSVFYVPSFPEISVIHTSYFYHFRNIPSFMFRTWYFIISGLCRCFSVFHVPLFPEIVVIHISSLFHYLQIIASCFRLSCSVSSRKFPSFIFHHFRIIPSSCRFEFWPSAANLIQASRPSYYIISRLLRRRVVLAVRNQFDPGFPSISDYIFRRRAVLTVRSQSDPRLPPFIFLYFRIIPSSAVRSHFDPGLFFLETETNSMCCWEQEGESTTYSVGS